VAQAVERLLCKCKGLSSNPSSTKGKKKKKSVTVYRVGSNAKKSLYIFRSEVTITGLTTQYMKEVKDAGARAGERLKQGSQKVCLHIF
jgi:hypothetical protein